MDPSSPPSSILIIGSGVFGLSTAFELTRRPFFARTSITVLDRSPDNGVFPSSDASSIDSSRIIRPDYADPAYASLAAKAHEYWRQQVDDELGGQGRYTESGMILLADSPSTAQADPKTGLGAKQVEEKKKSALEYVRESWDNVRALAAQEASGLSAEKIRELPNATAVMEAMGTDPTIAAVNRPGDWGYLNGTSGWADAEKSMAWFFNKVRQTGRVNFVHGTATALTRTGDRVTGARLDSGRHLEADLVIVATGAWTGALVDLAGQAIATGQALAYMDITPEEQAALCRRPVILNLSTGLFVIPPAVCQLKVARHSYGYINPQPTSPDVLPTRPGARLPANSTSLPRTLLSDPNLRIPSEGEADLRRAIRAMVPLKELHNRPFVKTRLCWYTDTSTGDFLIDYHPGWKGLFVATAGSGHGFKFLPVIGELIVDCLKGRRPAEFDEKWKWKGNDAKEDVQQLDKHIVTEDGSRGGRPGLILAEELAKDNSLKPRM
ncbi:FAD dependent oxidoreductase [Sodiomyces alkalinus F11]|uniref:FAD dependent oxidoreductase n=1 Tax=Sodiomyces alkalinus (strain CBS 110278 / VKM F-3762 / F11) TaxID=1314773 RepID=A0A3N2PQ79_SODAK|nr:FAD dependent oxidoreductase [Sodiomyces alkalinus F11]ROT36655.1 FAD dependent oxidoreductase [Sodiomyces alkalinus F11]